MAPAITHFLIGASIVLLLATPVAVRYRLSPWAPLWLVVLGGLWGLAPDVHHIAPAYTSELYAFHNSRWADLFAFHYTLDRPAVRARTNASIFVAIASFLGAIGVFTLANVWRTRVPDVIPVPISVAIAASPALVLLGMLLSVAVVL
ncbi:hypothetical protein RBH26_20345 [Natronolimnohabitans sp. A-GB9]|uniref:hypothetical protein n=1 Tax=Natronolimnohabitans sp. A-GB9 TaxID=3069757 RepID=UPI0027B19166|nr:hypothetical protein [Natronolimnohabitans sp. A-GB9]MDQ2052794.1 hypothetical protein [Natronolimnohabitans sp. A-GB9]